MTTGAERAQHAQAGPSSAWRAITSATLLAAVTVAWAAEPLSGGPAGTRVTVAAAICCGALSVAQLAIGKIRQPQAALSSLAERTWQYLLGIIRAVPWAELLLVLVLVLEVMHRPRPWHTGVLGVALIAYLLAIHLHETRARPGVLRGELPLIAAGIGLAALAAGAAELPGLPAGVISAAVRLIATIGACVVGGLAVPIWRRRRKTGG